MSELATLARPYAAAVFKRAKEAGATEDWSETLSFLCAVLANEDLSAIVGNPKVGKQQVLALVLAIGEGRLSGEAENFLKLLVQNNRLSLLPSIAEQFETYKAADEGYIDVEVSTAFGFSEEAEREFASKLEQLLNKKIHINVTVDQSLIGGVLVRAGDRVIDGSIRGQLQQLAKRL